MGLDPRKDAADFPSLFPDLALECRLLPGNGGGGGGGGGNGGGGNGGGGNGGGGGGNGGGGDFPDPMNIGDPGDETAQELPWKEFFEGAGFPNVFNELGKSVDLHPGLDALAQLLPQVP